VSRPGTRPVRAPTADWLSLRLVLATAAVLAAAHAWTRELVGWLMPLLSWALGYVADDFRILSLEFADDRGNASVAALALLDHTIILGGRAIVPDDRSVIGVSATLGTVVQPILVALVLVLAWPGRLIEGLAGLLIVVPLLGVVILLDTPFSMAAWLWFTQIQSYEPGRASPLVWWNVFLNGGGRLALGLVAGALAITLAQLLMALWTRRANRRVAEVLEGATAGPLTAGNGR